MYETLNSQGDRTDVDFVLLGCPHASVNRSAGPPRRWKAAG